MSVDEEKNILSVKGSVAGHKGSYLVIKSAKKRPPKDEGQKETSTHGKSKE